MQTDMPASMTTILPVSPANSSSSATGSGVTPLTEAIDRFANGMRTATEFLRMPNTYFKSRFQMSSIPAEHCGNISLVWDHMMNHFHMHAQQVVQFAKLIPGFNQFSLPTRSALVREGMYSVLLLLLSRDFQTDTDHFNYFDFSSEERAVIMHHFPSFRRIEEHLCISGRLANKLKFTLQELSISCAIEILRNYYIVDDTENSNVQSLYLLARNSLMKCMSSGSDLSEDQSKARWVNLEALSEMLGSMNKEHHQILTDLKSSRGDLQFPELYVEMFQLADDAAALVSAAVVAYCRNNSTAQLPGSSTELLRSSSDVNLVLDLGGGGSGCKSTSPQGINAFLVEGTKPLQPPPTSMFNILNYQSSMDPTQDSASTEQDAKAQISSPF
ncbi:hypothetical protein Ciccas_004914 [Cichlidogyrus casuarinus]|uniref:NR LBD domain-containing protein n=1 Tax=Cichlidogyrus casuarinus TaxID=1844966 RepID=A0ABD2QA57_9PLAT